MDHVPNPTRPYKYFRPRQAARGNVNLASSVNFATCLLTNASTGAFYLVLREWRLSSGAANTVRVASTKALTATATGVTVPMVPDMAAPDGVMGSVDAATQIVADYRIVIPAGADQWYQHDYPFGVIPPQWSLAFQAQTAAQALVLSAVWESVAEEELDSVF